MSMFCYQCEQTAKGTGCTVQGVCGKDSETATIQDLLLYSLKGLGMVARRARKLGVKDRAVDVFTMRRNLRTGYVVRCNCVKRSKLNILKPVARTGGNQRY